METDELENRDKLYKEMFIQEAKNMGYRWVYTEISDGSGTGIEKTLIFGPKECTDEEIKANHFIFNEGSMGTLWFGAYVSLLRVFATKEARFLDEIK